MPKKRRQKRPRTQRKMTWVVALVASMTMLLLGFFAITEARKEASDFDRAVSPRSGIADREQEDPFPTLSSTRLFRDVERYTRLGVHKRTGSAANRRINRWLSRGLRNGGYRQSLQSFELDRFQLYRCVLVVKGIRRDCFPLWYPNESTLINEPIPALEVQGFSFATLNSEGGLAKAIASNPPGLVLVNSILPKTIGINASLEMATKPLPMPIVVVGDQDRELLVGESSTEGTVDQLGILGSARPNSVAQNVIGYRPARQPTSTTVVISTPTTAWFRAGGERGPGIALWRGLARWAALKDWPVNLLFVATAGHELGYMGMREFLSGFAVPDEVLFWVHLGASIVTQATGEDGAMSLKYARLDYNDPTLSSTLDRYLKPIGFKPEPQSERTAGTLAFIMDRGYRAFGFYGAFPKFHTPEDLADSTSGEALEPVAQALARSIADLIQNLPVADAPVDR